MLNWMSLFYPSKSSRVGNGFLSLPTIWPKVSTQLQKYDIRRRYEIKLPNIENRLRKRYQRLVMEHIRVAEQLASGLRALVDCRMGNRFIVAHQLRR
ncbi:MAG: hypothetical protein BWK78_03745 [Thiotrichaceae bacterium IS1]|nr:MAG: hypothetical protein BWK78_03745 [Thiotrichaceae bacterium IS1]